MRKRRAKGDNNQRSAKKRKTNTNEDHSVPPVDTDINEGPLYFDVADLPLEILGNLIFKYFTFKFWLKSLVRVSKQWHQAAIQSNSEKQLFIDAKDPSNLSKYYFAANKYKVTTIILQLSTMNITMTQLYALLSSSPKIHTFVYDNRYSSGVNDQCSKLTLPFIKTAFIHSSLLSRFPNATRVQLSDDGGILWDEIEKCPNVEELSLQELDDESISTLLEVFPSLKILHVANIDERVQELIPRKIEVRVSSIQNNEKWKKFYSLNQTWGHDILLAVLDHAMECFEINNTRAKKTQHKSIEHEVSVLERYEEYEFPAIAMKPVDIFSPNRSRSNAHVDPPEFFCRHMDLNYELVHLLRKNNKKREMKSLLQRNSHQLSTTIRTNVLVAVMKKLSAADLKKCFTKDQLEQFMKRSDSDTGTIVRSFIDTNSSPEDLDNAIKNFGSLPDDWQTVESNMDPSLISLAKQCGRYDWVEYLINNGVKVDIANFFWDMLIEDEDEGGARPNDDWIQQFKNIIQLIHQKNSYLKHTNWLFDSDWQYSIDKLKFIDFFVEEFNINIHEITQEDELSVDERSSFINYVIGLMHEVDEIDLITSIIQKYKIDLNRPDGNGYTPLLKAMDEKKSKLVVWLLENGASPNEPKTCLPLYSLVSETNNENIYEYIDTLLAYGADINGYCKNNEIGHDGTALLQAIYFKQPLDLIKYLIIRGAKVDIVDSKGRTAIHYAVICGSDQIPFLANYVDVNKTDEAGNSALHFAARKSNRGVSATLLKCGADVNQINDSGKTPLMIACANCNMEAVECILQCNPDIRARDHNGESFVYHFAKKFSPALLICAKSYMMKIIKPAMTKENIAFMIDESKKLLERAKTNQLLMHAIFEMCTHRDFLAEFLIEHVGFDIDTQDEEGNTVMSYPMKKDLFAYLMTKNPNVNIKNNRGKSPLMLMQEDKHAKKDRLNALIEQSRKHPTH